MVTVAGTTIHALPENKLAAWRGRNVGFVFQFFQLLPTLTVVENVMLPMDFCKTFPARERRKRAEALLERVGVGPHADKLPTTLSGGEQQRVAIARALVHEPRVVLADEPTGNLDLETAQQVLALLQTTCRRRQTTLIMATHSREAASVADRVLSIREARIEDGAA